jgi:hypothetical protein
MFTETQLWEIIKYFNLARTQVQRDDLRALLTQVEALSSVLVAQVQAELIQLSELEEDIQSGIGIKKADTVEFDAAQRAAAAIARSIQLLQSIGRSIQLEPDLTPLKTYAAMLGVGNQPRSLTLEKIME